MTETWAYLIVGIACFWMGGIMVFATIYAYSRHWMKTRGYCGFCGVDQPYRGPR